MSTEAAELSYAVRLRVVGKYCGQLGLILAALTLVPLGFSVFCGDYALAGRYVEVIGPLIILGAVLGRMRVPRDVQVNEGMVIVALMFLISPLLMAYPLMSTGMSYPDALFEAVSGITTTGLSTLGTVEGAPPAFLFARAWMQWYGGLGIVVLSLALLARPGLVARGLAATEPESEDLIGSTRAHARRISIVYLALTAAGFVWLWVLLREPAQAVLYTLAAISTGGFAPHDASLGALSGMPGRASVIFICLLGAVPLAFYHQVLREGKAPREARLQLLAIVLCGLVVSALLLFFLSRDPGLTKSEVWSSAPLLAFSAQSTAGFSILDPARFDSASKLSIIGAMLIGGGVGSTAGGLKILRLLILFKLLRMMVHRTRLARHAVTFPGLAGRRLSEDEARDALLLILLFIGVTTLSWLPFLAGGYDAIDSLFEVVSAVGTVGLSVGVSGSELPGALKGVLCADMLLGRLEIIAWLVLFSSKTWFGRRLEQT